MCKKFFTLLSFFVFFSSNFAFSQEIKWLDFERLIKKHPMMKNFDPSTNRFRNTNSEIKKVEDLNKQLASVSSRLNQTKASKDDVIKKFLTSDSSGNEENKWSLLKDLEAKISSLSLQEESLRESLKNNGFTAVTAILPIVRSILRDQLKPYANSSSKVVINKLPRFSSPPVKIDKNPLRKMVLESNISESDLKQYLKQAHSISLMFKATDIPVLFPGDSN